MDAPVKLWQPMLAGKVTDVHALPFPMAASPKYDGVRAFVRGGVLLARSLKPIRNKMLQLVLAQKAFEGLDGELVCGDPSAPDCFKRSSQMCSTADAGVEDAIFFVFDKMDDPEMPFEDRLIDAKRVIGSWQVQVGGVGISIVRQKPVHDVLGLNQIEEIILGLKFEGVMLRKMDAPYKHGRSTENEAYLLKLKRFEMDEAEVFGAFEQLHNANEATTDARGYTKRTTHKANKVGKGTLGGFHVKMKTGDFKGVACDVGTGWTDEERDQLWALWKQGGVMLINRTMGLLRVKWQKVGSKDRPRFPVASGWRHKDDT